MKKIYLGLTLMIAFNLGYSQVLLEEDFDYGSTSTDLITASSGNWATHSGTSGQVTYETTSLSMTNYPSTGVGGSITIKGSDSEDINRSFTEQTSGKIYFSTLINVSSVGSGNYFLHLATSSTSSFTARVGAKSDGNSGVLFGIGASSSTLTYGTTRFSTNTTYLLVGTYDFTSGTSDLYVLDTYSASEPSTPEATNTGSIRSDLGTVAFRQSSGIPDVTIDGVRVGLSWSDLMTISQDTKVEFSSASVSADEADGTVSLTATIENPSQSVATTVDVILSSGADIDLGSYTTQTLTFPAGSSSSQSATITITDNSDLEGTKEFSFTLSNILGGSSAVIGSQSNITLTLSDDEANAANDPNTCDNFFSVKPVTLNSQNDNWSCSDGGWYINGYVGSSATDDPTETWLVSKPIDFSSATAVGFQYSVASGFGGSKTPELVVSTDFDGDVSSSTWTTIQPIDNSDGNNNFVDLTSTTAGEHYAVVAIKYIADGNSAEVLDLTGVAVIANAAPKVYKVWTGATDGDWNTAGNWDGGVPTSTDNVAITADGTSLSISSDLEAALVAVNKSSGITITWGSLKASDDMIIDGSITVNSGASLLPMAGVSGSGSATINRSTTFSDTEGRYSVIGSPVTSANTDALGSIVYSYDESTAYGSDGSARFTEVTAAEGMTPGDAYFSANTGDIAFMGLPNSGTISKDVVYDESADGSAANAGYNLVSNPYTAAIDADAFITANSATIGGSIYLWDDGGSMTGQRDNNDYIVYNSSTGMATRTASGGREGNFDDYIRSAQGFFVKATTAGSVSFTPALMTTGSNSDAGFFREGINNVIRVSISDTELYSDMLISMRDGATAGIDAMYDSYKPIGSKGLQLYSVIEGAAFAVQGLPESGIEHSLDIRFNADKAGAYTIKLEEGAFENHEIYLIDRQLDKVIDMNAMSAYSFNSGAVMNSDRFQLLLTPAAVLGFENAKNFTAFTSNGILNVRSSEISDLAQIKVFSLNGRMICKSLANMESGEVSLPFAHKGLFIVTVESKNNTMVQKIIAK